MKVREDGFKKEGKWWVSPDNYVKEITEQYEFPETIRFLYKGIIINHNKNRANLH